MAHATGRRPILDPASTCRARASDPRGDVGTHLGGGAPRAVHPVLQVRPHGGAHARGRVFAGVSNLADRRYIGSVIVNDGNGRYFEPGAGRAFTLGVEAHWGD